MLEWDHGEGRPRRGGQGSTTGAQKPRRNGLQNRCNPNVLAGSFRRGGGWFSPAIPVRATSACERSAIVSPDLGSLREGRVLRTITYVRPRSTTWTAAMNSGPAASFTMNPEAPARRTSAASWVLAYMVSGVLTRQSSTAGQSKWGRQAVSVARPPQTGQWSRCGVSQGGGGPRWRCVSLPPARWPARSRAGRALSLFERR